MSQLVNKAKAWNTPIWFMVGMMIITFLGELAMLKIAFKNAGLVMPGKALFSLLLWPTLILVDAIIYWVIRKRIKERKWVWAHLIFSLFAFVLLRLLYIGVAAIYLYYYTDHGDSTRMFRLMNRMQYFCFWSSLIIGHVFFVIAIVRSFSGESAQLPPDDNDLLSEMAS